MNEELNTTQEVQREPTVNTTVSTTGVESVDLNNLWINTTDHTITYPSITTTGSGTIISGSNTYTTPSYVWTTAGSNLNEDEIRKIIKDELDKRSDELLHDIENSYVAMTGEYLWIKVPEFDKQCVAHVTERGDNMISVLMPDPSITYVFKTIPYGYIEGEATLADWIGQEKEFYKKSK